ncbi:MAG: XRE family transcriptional regulator [Hyphomicrobiales bacterium]|nr:MAG: XRE family transcriptional regulator [Hyphomicrobiales bacterium]
MRDSLRSPRQQQLRALLRGMRIERSLTQADVADRLAKPQSFVAKYEGGERRLSVVEFIDVVKALEANPSDVLRHLVKLTEQGKRQS